MTKNKIIGVLAIVNRVASLRNRLLALKVESILVSQPENVRYLSGFTGGDDARLLITSQDKYIISDSRYREQILQECPGWALIEEKARDNSQLHRLTAGFSNLGFESQSVSYDNFAAMQKNLQPQLIPLTGVVEADRIIKDENELCTIRRAAGIGDEVFTELIGWIKPGMSEKMVADQIAGLLRKKGCSREAFDAIVVAGENAALPHGRPGNRPLESGDMVTMDFGGNFQGYMADMTRTIALGHISRDLYDRYMAVLEAQELGISLARAGIKCQDLDEAVRNCLESKGLGEFFLHSTGHGVGLQVHEQPALSANNDMVLAPGMVITIEPGIYIKGWGGIRIEDTVIVQEGGCEVITRSDKTILKI